MHYICIMQLQFPFYPKEARLINPHVGVYERGDFVQYIVNGMPIFSHGKEDINLFRYITSNLISQGLCRKVEIVRTFGVSEDSVSRAYKKFKERGADGFFGTEARHGHAHKILGERKVRILRKIDKGQSVNSIAIEEGVGESSIRYAIKQGYLKKNRKSK